MISYLVTFHSNSGHIHRTVLLGSNLEEIKMQVLNGVDFSKNGADHFESYGNKNVLFTINHANITCVEYEMLGEVPILSFDKLCDLNPETLVMVIDNLKNDLILGIALVHSEKEFVTKITSCLSDNRKKVITDIIKLELGKIKMNDVIQAQGEVIKVLSQLHKEDKIDIDLHP